MLELGVVARQICKLVKIAKSLVETVITFFMPYTIIELFLILRRECIDSKTLV